jgi:hypothetical protein
LRNVICTLQKKITNKANEVNWCAKVRLKFVTQRMYFMSILRLPFTWSLSTYSQTCIYAQGKFKSVCGLYEWICYKSGGFSPASCLGCARLFLGFSLGFGMDKMSLTQFVYRAVSGSCVSGC